MPPPEPLPYLKPEPMDLDVLFEDDHLIVLNKPAGLTVHPAPGNKDGTLVNGLLHHCPDLPGISGKLRPGIVHRLDKDTTGCIVIAKSQEALVRCRCRFRNGSRHGSTSPSFMACLAAIPARSSAPLAVIRRTARSTRWYRKRPLCLHPLDPGGTSRRLLPVAFQARHRTDPSDPCSLRPYEPPRGGDPDHSRCRKLPIELPGQALHAVQLGLDHLITRERMVFQALPPVMEKLLWVLRRRASSG